MPQDQMQAAELLRSKRDKLNKLPPEVRTKVLGLFFNRTVLPKLKASGLTKEELGIAQDRWQKGIMGEKQEPLPKEFGQRKEATPGLDTMEAFGAGGMSSLYGMMANLLRTYRKLPGEGPPPAKQLSDLIAPGQNHPVTWSKLLGGKVSVNEFLDQAIKDWEQKYSQYKQRAGELGSPKAAAAGGLTAGAALSIPAGEAGSSLIPGAIASKLPVIGSALKGAAGGATMAPLYTSDPQEIKRWAEIGGVGGAVLGKAADWIKGLKSSRAQRIATRTAKVVQKEEGPKATETLANDYDQRAQQKFGKNLADLSTQQQEELVNDVHQQKVAEKKTKGAKTPKTPTPTEGPGSPQWRRQQYIKLRSLGFDVKKGSPIYQSVHEGKSADDIIGTMKAAGAMASEEQPAVKKAVEGVAKTAPEVISPEPKPIETKPPEIDRKAGFLEKYGFTQGKKVGDSYVYQARKGDNLLEVTLDEGGTWGVKLRGPNFEEFVGEGEKNLRSTVLNLANKYGFRLGQKIPVGVSGIPEGQKKLLDRLSEVRAKISDTKVSPLAKDRLKKTEENIKKALGGDAEAERKLAESAKTAKRREVAGAGQTGQATGIEGGEKGAPGAVVPTTPEKTPTVELIDSLKGLSFPGQDTQKLYKSLEGMRKAGVSDATLSELADGAYRHIGNKLGIEDADEMPLEELYKRITSLGEISPQTEAVTRPVADAYNQKTLSNLDALAQTVGVTKFTQVSGMKSEGANLGKSWYDYIAKVVGPKDADNEFMRHMYQMGIHGSIAEKLLQITKEGHEHIIAKPGASIETVVHEVNHTLSHRLGVPNDEVAPSAVVQHLTQEIGEFPHPWIERSHEAYTELLTQYFMRDFRKAEGLPYMKPGSWCFKLAEFMINSSNDPKIRNLVGHALGIAVGATGVWKGVSGGRTSTDGTS